MSCFQVYYDKKSGAKKMREILSKNEYMLLRNTYSQIDITQRVRNGQPDLKRNLLQCNYSCLPNNDGTLKGSKVCSNSVGMDIDHITTDELENVKAKVLSKKDEIGLLMMELSARGCGYHIVFKRNPVLTQEGNLRHVSDVLGVKYDENAKDITRVFFTTPSEDLIFISEDLFVNAPCEQGATETQSESIQTQVMQEFAPPKMQNFYAGVPLVDIVRELENQLGGAPAHGSRNNFIFTMACHLRYVCNHNAEAVKKILPTYGEDSDKWAKTIESACSRSMSDQMPQVLKMAISLASTSAPLREHDDEQPPQMPHKLPALVELLVSNTPDIYKPAVAHAIFPPLASHLYDVRFPYIDNVEHEATLMCVLMAGTGAGKNCTSEPIRFIMEDILERDAISRERERVWKEDMQTRGANKDKRKRPDGIIIQNVKPDMTNAAFVQRMKEAEGRFLYSQMNEIDQFDALKTSAKSKAQFQIMCLAFDPNNTYGTERVGASSVSETVCVRFNWNASTTINKGKKYFNGVLTDGPISRINFCTIPEREIGADMPIYGTYDEKFSLKLRPFINNLNCASGRIECAEALALAREIMENNKETAQMSQSRTFENLSFRANVIAYLKAMVLYVANGCKWDETFKDFIKWSEAYDLYCKMQFFGEDIENQTTETHRSYQARNLLTFLPNQFSKVELQQVRRARGVDKGDVSKLISAWKKRGHIRQIDDNTFEKVNK